MHASPFRNVILPALLAASATFTLLTLPVTSDRAHQAVGRLPLSIKRWVPTSLTNQQKDISIRYIGFVVLSSVAVGIGTSEILRVRQTRVCRYQALLEQALREMGSTSGNVAVWGTYPTAESLGENLASWQSSHPAGFQADLATTPEPDAGLDWDALLQETGAIEESELHQAEPPLMSMTAEILPTEAYTTYRILSMTGQRLIAISHKGKYFSVYRRRATLKKTQEVVDQLNRQGKSVITTQDEEGYIVWLHQPGASLDTSTDQALLISY